MTISVARAGFPFGIRRSPFAVRLASNRLHPLPDDPIEQLRIRQSRLPCRKSEVFVRRENRHGLDELKVPRLLCSGSQRFRPEFI